jgi:hypothetical protein
MLLSHRIMVYSAFLHNDYLTLKLNDQCQDSFAGAMSTLSAGVLLYYVYCDTIFCGELQCTATEALGWSEYSQKIVFNFNFLYMYVAGSANG